VRIVGYCSVQHFDECAEFVAKGDTYAEDDPDRRFESHTDNLVAEPADLWISFADD
jgi:hypothetical protein